MCRNRGITQRLYPLWRWLRCACICSEKPVRLHYPFQGRFEDEDALISSRAISLFHTHTISLFVSHACKCVAGLTGANTLVGERARIGASLSFCNAAFETLETEG